MFTNAWDHVSFMYVVWACSCVFAHVCAHVYGGQRLISHSSPYVLRQGLSLELVYLALVCSRDLLSTSWLLRSRLLCLPGIYMNPEDLNSGLYVCMVSTYPVEQSHRPRIMFLKVRFMGNFHLNHRFIANIIVHGLYSRWFMLASWIKSHRSAFIQAT